MAEPTADASSASPGENLWFKWGLPGAITCAAIAYLVNTIDFTGITAHITPRSASILLPAILGFGFTSLAIEAVTLRRLLHSSRSDFTYMMAARVKSASYLLAILHYALGAATLTVLVSRRAGVTLQRAAGVVGLVMMFDLGMVLSMVALGTALTSSSAIEVQFGALLGIIAVIAGGLALLRAPFSLGPLDRIRDLELFESARSAPVRDLVELAVLRFVFVLIFECMGWAALHAFEIEAPLSVVMVNFSGVVLASMLPAVAGIGPSQVAMVEFFAAYGAKEQLLACSVSLSASMIAMRALMGIAFAGEFSREALAVSRTVEVSPHPVDGEPGSDNPGAEPLPSSAQPRTEGDQD
ncbi:MAG: lysylphosphatidylglycerol synthase domain-containing protein [Myxococcota bacterium]|jgi:hypothetical protein|nr:lysylphosphatidylglycerol synthase domain-containing protein [Myxococcota bacterium]